MCCVHREVELVFSPPPCLRVQRIKFVNKKNSTQWMDMRSFHFTFSRVCVWVGLARCRFFLFILVTLKCRILFLFVCVCVCDNDSMYICVLLDVFLTCVILYY